MRVSYKCWSPARHLQAATLRSRSHAPIRGNCSPPPEFTRTTRTSSARLPFLNSSNSPAAQQQAFHRQLELAARIGKPVFLHQRDAHADFVAILSEHAANWRGVAHCFTGAGAELDCYLQLGLAIGITGWICDERRGAHLAALMPRIPAGRLLLESDGPYLLPRNLSPKPASRRNEPAYLPQVAGAVARARGEDVATLAHSSTAAARALFKLPQAS